MEEALMHLVGHALELTEVLLTHSLLLMRLARDPATHWVEIGAVHPAC